MQYSLRILLVGFAIFLAPDAYGCTIPVFRYALEKWELTPYDILVYHRGPLPADLQEAIKAWDHTPSKANIDITLIDLDGKVDPKLEKLWKREGDGKQTPWMLVRNQASGANEPSAWSGPFTKTNLQSVLDSPMRQAILKHLAGGASVVYVFVTSADAKADATALALATKELQSLEKLLKLPVQSAEGPQMRLPLPLKLSLPLLVLDRSKAEEAAFVKLLLATEEDLDQVKGPILFPIFGRGRVLGSFSGKEFSKDMIMQATQFLCKECSCQVKELNPGVDMLLATNWNDVFDKLFEAESAKEKTPGKQAAAAKVPPASPRSGAPLLLNSVPSCLTPAKEAPPATEPPTTSDSETPPAPSISADTPTPGHCGPCRLSLWIGTGIAAGLVLASGAWVVMQMRKS